MLCYVVVSLLDLSLHHDSIVLFSKPSSHTMDAIQLVSGVKHGFQVEPEITTSCEDNETLNL